MSAIVLFDNWVLHLVNVRFTYSFLDTFMPFITDKNNFVVPGAIIWFLFFLFGRNKDRVVLIILLVVIMFSDLSASLLKNFFHRARPCSVLSDIRLLSACGSSFSLPSNHAANIFAASIYLSIHYRRFLPLFVAVALLVAYSRIYVGVHYPTDVMAGAFVGTLIAFFFTRIELPVFSCIIYLSKRYKWRDKKVSE